MLMVQCLKQESIFFSSSSWGAYDCSVLNKIDTVKDKELVDLVEEEIRELLTLHKFPGDKILIVKVQLLNAVEEKDEATGKNAIMELMKAVDETIPQPDRPKDKPFLMPVEDVFSISEEVSNW